MPEIPRGERGSHVGKDAGELIEGGGAMDFLEIADPGIVQADALTSLAFAIIKILGYGAVGVVLVGLLASGLCDFFECQKWKRYQGRTEVWRLMH